MSMATLLIIVIPVFFIMVEKVRERFSRRARDEMTVDDQTGTETGQHADNDGRTNSHDHSSAISQTEKSSGEDVDNGSDKDSEPPDGEDPGPSDSDKGPAKGE
jgi:hypothetical protein